MIREVEPDWLSGQGRHPRGRASALPPGLLGLPLIPVASGVF